MARGEIALKLASKGFYVFPVAWVDNGVCVCRLKAECKNTGKHPCIGGWEAEASVNPDKIRGWWEKWPKANIGIATGPSGLVVIDVDMDGEKKGRESFEELCEYVPGARSTTVCRTGGGGEHHYFRGRSIGSQGVLGDGIDTRSTGNLVIAHGSQTDKGTYAWKAFGYIPPWPEVLEARIQEGRKRATADINNSDDPIPKGQRHHYFLSVAAKLRNLGMGYEEILQSLLAINARRCPDHDENDIEKIARAYADKDGRTVEQITASLTGKKETPKEGKKKLSFTNYSNIKQVELEWLMPGFIPNSGYVLLYGAPGKGKSYMTVGLAADISNGAPLPGVDMAMGVKPRDVLLFSYEDDAATVIKHRLLACGADMSRIHTVLPDDGEFTWKDVSLLEEAVQDIGNIGLVVLDPITSWSVGVDNNSETQVRAALSPLHRLGQKLKIPMLGVAHTNKLTQGVNRIMGSRAWEGVARSVILAGHDNEKDQTTGVTYGGIVQAKINLGAMARPIGYKIDKGKFIWTGYDPSLTQERLLEKPKEKDSK